MSWIINDDGYRQDNITFYGNKYLTGNGYLGIRGTLSEYEKEEYPAINLAGIYDRVGDGWREPLNAPNGLFTFTEFNGKGYRLPQVVPVTHKVSLNFRYGIFSRDTSWGLPKGTLRISEERLASLAEPHLIVMRYCILTDCDGEVRLTTGIDGDVWDINGPHYDELKQDQRDGILLLTGITHENRDRVCVAEHSELDFDADCDTCYQSGRYLRRYTFYAKANQTYTLTKYITVLTNKDMSDYEEAACRLVKEARGLGYDKALEFSKEVWDRKWLTAEVEIEGDEASMEALNYSIYQLLSVAPRHSDSLSIAARGLSGQTYKGAVFWDTEMFMLDLFLFTEPTVAKTLLRYRIDTLEGAKKKASQYGCQGAFYAWESQEGGYDACSDYNVTDVFTGRPMRTYFKDKQIHISSAVVYGIMRYLDFTGDLSLLYEGGAATVIECARFYYGLLIKRSISNRYELLDVIGPDEYHERVNNNAYTNRMAKFTFESALRVINLLETGQPELIQSLASEYDFEQLKDEFSDAAEKLYLPQPEPDSRVIEQFDGYYKLEEVALEKLKERILHEKEYWGGAYGIAAHTKIIKQADVVTMLNLFSEEYEKEVLQRNWDYYEPRTEHGSSLSACMYAMLACKCGMPDKAYPLFLKSATADLRGGGKEWAGLIYIGGTHPASAGGAYMTAIEGFAGLTIKQGRLSLAPNLPTHWNSLSFRVYHQGKLYQAKVTKDRGELIRLS